MYDTEKKRNKGERKERKKTDEGPLLFGKALAFGSLLLSTMLLEAVGPVQQLVLSFLCHKSLAIMECTCIHFRNAISSENCWKALCERSMYGKIMSLFTDRTSSWKDSYLQLISCSSRGKRVARELTTLLVEPVPNIINFVIDLKMTHITFTITGPKGSLYEGGTFLLGMDIPPTYPFQSPSKIRFSTPMLHCNINRHGDICTYITDNWAPNKFIKNVLIEVVQLLRDPNPNDPLVPELARLLQVDPESYNQKVREHVRQNSENKNT